MRTLILTLAIAFLASTQLAVAQHSRLLPLRPLETFNGLSTKQLEEIASFAQDNPDNITSIIQITQCVEKTLSRKEYDELLQFGQSAKHNIREDCFNGDRAKATRYAQEKFKEFSRTKIFKSMGSCLKSQQDIDVMTQVVMAQMGINPSRGEAAHICDAYEKK